MERSLNEKKIWVACPACCKTGAVPVDQRVVEGALEQQGDKLLRLQIFAGDICEHAFSIIVDAHLHVR